MCDILFLTCSIDQPSPAILRAFGKSLHHYVGVPNLPLIAMNRDPLLAEFGVKPSNKAACCIVGPRGAVMVGGIKCGCSVA